MLNKLSYILPILILSTIESNALADGDLKLAVKNDGSKIKESVSLTLNHTINKYFSLYSYTVIQTDGWGESYFGLNYSLNNFSTWFAAGAQQSNNVFSSQFNLGFKIGKKNFFEVDTELDPSLVKNSNSLWYDIIYSHNLSDNFNIGLRARRNVGSGLYFNVDYKINTILCWLPVNQEFFLNSDKVFDPTRFYIAVKFPILM